MIVQMDAASPVPAYEQIRSQIATMVSSGVLGETLVRARRGFRDDAGAGGATGHRLPPIRQLAADLDIANGTVARAYKELERDGWVATRGRKGTFLQEGPAGPRDHRGELEAAARRFATTVVQLGADRDDARRAIDEALDAIIAPAATEEPA